MEPLHWQQGALDKEGMINGLSNMLMAPRGGVAGGEDNMSDPDGRNLTQPGMATNTMEGEEVAEEDRSQDRWGHEASA